ncbi:MAG TPA: hypothetical protein VGM90_14980 [Kofleriaceae bacterium]|jgi:hypothetical protein
MWRPGLVLLIACAPTIALADEHISERPVEIQIDGGLSVIAAGVEVPVSPHWSAMLGAGIFGSYFLPWFDVGDNTIGVIADARVTWFHRTHGSSLYITPYVRTGVTKGTNDDLQRDGSGPVLTGGFFVGYAFDLSHVDLRLGVGAQYIYIDGSNGIDASTVFPALDFTLGFH